MGYRSTYGAIAPIKEVQCFKDDGSLITEIHSELNDIILATEFCTMLLMFCGRNLVTIGEAIGGFETFLKRKNKTIHELSDERLSELFKNYCEQTSKCSENNIFAKG